MLQYKNAINPAHIHGCVIVDTCQLFMPSDTAYFAALLTTCGLTCDEPFLERESCSGIPQQSVHNFMQSRSAFNESWSIARPCHAQSLALLTNCNSQMTSLKDLLEIVHR